MRIISKKHRNCRKKIDLVLNDSLVYVSLNSQQFGALGFEYKALIKETTVNLSQQKFKTASAEAKFYKKHFVKMFSSYLFCVEICKLYNVAPSYDAGLITYLNNCKQHYKTYKNKNIIDYMSFCKANDAIDIPRFHMELSSLQEAKHYELFDPQFSSLMPAYFMAIEKIDNYLNTVIAQLKQTLIATTRPALYKWDSNKTDLALLIVHLSRSECFVRADGQLATATELAQMFESIIDIKVQKNLFQLYGDFKNRQKLENNLLTQMHNMLLNSDAVL